MKLRCGLSSFALDRRSEEVRFPAESWITTGMAVLSRSAIQGVVDLNGWMVENGWAISYRSYSLGYVEQEEAARNKDRGIWRDQVVLP